MPTMSVSWTDKNYAGLIAEAEKSGKNRSTIANEAMSLYLRELQEDKEDAVTGEEAWVEFKASGKKAIPAEKVYKDAGL